MPRHPTLLQLCLQPGFQARSLCQGASRPAAEAPTPPTAQPGGATTLLPLTPTPAVSPEVMAAEVVALAGGTCTHGLLHAARPPRHSLQRWSHRPARRWRPSKRLPWGPRARRAKRSSRRRAGAAPPLPAADAAGCAEACLGNAVCKPFATCCECLQCRLYASGFEQAAVRDPPPVPLLCNGGTSRLCVLVPCQAVTA